VQTLFSLLTDLTKLFRQALEYLIAKDICTYYFRRTLDHFNKLWAWSSKPWIEM